MNKGVDARRTILKNGESAVSIAKRFGVHHVTVRAYAER